MCDSARRRTARNLPILIISLWLASCGRIGVHILPSEEDPLSLNGGIEKDASTDLPDAGQEFGTSFSCATSCENPHGSASCTAGSCVSTCALGYSDCDGDQSNGCETDVATRAMSCGGCALSCTN